MAKSRSRNTRRRQGGGGVGATYGFTGGNAFSQTINNPIMTTSAPSTDIAAVRTGFMGGAPPGNGLPGVQEVARARCASTVAAASASTSAAKRRAAVVVCKAVVAMDLMERWMEP